MRLHLLREFGAVALAAGVLAVACGDDDRPSGTFPAGGEGGSGGSSSGKGGKAGKGGSSSGTAGEGSAGDSSQAGEQGQGGAAPGCGDGLQEGSEECDAPDVDGLTCSDFGFDDGELSCDASCVFDTSACSGVEHCGDGRDNDGDQLADCEDEEDCEDTCAAPCMDPPLLADPAEVQASTLDRGQIQSSSCSAVTDVSGPDLAYRFTPAVTGTLEIAIDSTQPLDVVVRGDCSDAAELACSNQFLSVPVTAGEDVFIIVDGHEADDAGGFTLNVHSRPNDVCGDGYRDAGEGCDDGNLDALDGCDSSCDLELDESESNDDTASADALSAYFTAEISPSDDVDFVEVVIASTPASIRARTLDFSEECERDELDSMLQIIDTDGTTVLEFDDDSGSGTCSDVIASGLSAGTYFVRVAASSPGATPAFAYRLDVSVNACGDGILGPGEECDDSNQAAGDGCSASCQDE